MWLLRDILALLGFLISFWPLIILVITNGFKAIRGKKVPKSVYDEFPILLAHTKARLDWDRRAVEFTLVEASDDWNETTRRFQSYQRAFGNLEAYSRADVHALCERYSTSQRDVTNSNCPGFRLNSSSFGGHVAGRGKQHRSFSSLSARH